MLPLLLLLCSFFGENRRKIHVIKRPRRRRREPPFNKNLMNTMAAVGNVQKNSCRAPRPPLSSSSNLFHPSRHRRRRRLCVTSSSAGLLASGWLNYDCVLDAAALLLLSKTKKYTQSSLLAPLSSFARFQIKMSWATAAYHVFASLLLLRRSRHWPSEKDVLLQVCQLLQFTISRCETERPLRQHSIKYNGHTKSL